MAEIKKKHLDRHEWYADSERDFVCMYLKDDIFHGGIGLITFTGLAEPEMVDTPEGPLCIADNGYQWLEIAPEDGHFAVTAMFHDNILFQQYIDITLRNEVDKDGNAVFYDLLLDIVILGNGTPRVIDTEELEEALSAGIITRNEYDLARQTADKVAKTWNSSKEQIEKKLYEYRELLQIKRRNIQSSEEVNESELYKALGALTKDRSHWEENVTYLSSLLHHDSEKIRAKALWLLGEIGLAYPHAVKKAVPAIAAFCDSPVPLLRERAINALGRIGRGNYQAIEPYWMGLFRFAADDEAKVRLSFIWASENIAANTPEIYENHMPVFGKLLRDPDDKVRMEAPEIFRVLGKRNPEFVRPFMELLKQVSETDSNRVVRIHCLGAIKAAELLQ